MKPKTTHGRKKKNQQYNAADSSDEDVDNNIAVSKTEKFKNLQRCLIVARRGITVEDRHFLKELQIMLPHSKKESKLDKHSHYTELVDLAAMKKCPNILLIERKRKELFLYAVKSPIGPTLKFKIQNCLIFCSF